MCGKYKSHPIRVRGLKPLEVDPSAYSLNVASYTGAWIETTSNLRTLPLTLSHPIRVRGLKPVHPDELPGLYRRILYGCVD